MKKREYPKTVFRKKLMKGVFWTGFTLVLFLSVVAIIRVGNAGAGATVQKQPQEEKAKEGNLAAGEGGQTFAENFAANYFDWQNTEEAKQKRMERLSPFLARGLDQQAGLAFEGMEWSSQLSQSQVWKVEETGEDSALVTLRVLHELSKATPPDAKAVLKAKKEKKEPPKATEEKTGPYEKYFVVPVKTDGQSFVVHQTPYFVTAPKKPKITAEAIASEEGKINDSVLQEEVKSFLSTFFKIYTTGTDEELAYYINGDGIQSMNGVMTFKEVKSIIIQEDNNPNHYEVDVTVIFTENQSKAQVVYPYQLKVAQEEGRWFVKEINHQ